MASSPFISHLKLYKVATFSQRFFYLNCNPKLRSTSTNLHLSAYRNNSSPSSSSSSSSCRFSAYRDSYYCYYYYFQRQTGISLIAFDAKNPESRREEDNTHNINEAIDPLFKFFSAITHRFITYTKSDILAHQWPFPSFFLSFLHAFQRRKQAWTVFSFLIQMFGNNVEFVFNETLHGLNIGVQWKFELEKIQIPLGKGFSFYISHSYRGKAMIRSSETFIKPLLNLLPFKLKIMASFERLRESMDSFMARESEDKPKQIWSTLTALLTITALFFLSRTPSLKLVLKLSRKP
ncbi:uncharacterized protein LOC129286124 [Prosopis cineraria]|uniref:uncharacterized protein LOC129286124 n=1 Tax=Prosopis cineraria TaxID=364024 RepID=UPI00240FD621|nr:uncharacterized protein LOC129286124 [Prosopis cineraria]